MLPFDKPFREIHAKDMDAVSLQEEMDAHGYVLLRGVLQQEDLAPLFWDVTRELVAAGWLKEGDSRVAVPSATCSEDDPAFKEVYDRVFGLPSFHALPHRARLQAVMQRLVGPQLLVHPKSAGRLIFPKFEPGIIHAHQDHTAVSGDPVSYTAWMPLHDCPVEQGPLRVLEGSHRLGLLPTDRGYVVKTEDLGYDWVGGEIRAGDVLIFHSLTVHEALPNVSDRMRISIDARFQSYARAVNPGTLVFAGSGRRSWERTYAAWGPEFDALKYYWTRLPLKFSPSLEELAELSRSSATQGEWERYGRILARMEEQMAVA